ncbi:argininosuccinate synthase [Rufibacter radiotolerans]|uniref:argininosuccinate synthase n=1 Tax=Rufibacter radiotolerans TaxID=1379910 RepID=A0A0H4W2L3_9BACT|nr:argininosuccinate synthase [Rufibacter radiotolerans]AKQ44676.1 argininosuccinate synthase [Rufibacter radiotolerans]
MKKVVLAFSGGLDTSFCVKYLLEQGYEIYSAIVNTGGFSEEELAEIARRAESLGVAHHVTLDETDNYYQTCLKYLIFGNVLKNNTYPLSVSAERISQAMAIAKYAQEVGAEAVAHGSTGAGNDQVRFDMVFNILIPNVEIITPIRDLKLSREEEIAYLKERGVEMDFQKAQYSINKGIWGTSVGGKETLTSDQALPESAYPTQLSKETPERITLHFKNGEPVGLNDVMFDNPVHVIQKLQEIAGAYAIGRDIHVGDTIIGIKGRVGFEAAAPMIIIKAHHALEKHTLTKWQLYWKDSLATWYGNWMHEGQFLDPTMRNIETFLADTQKTVTGKVYVLLAPYRFQVEGIESDHDLMSSKFGSYGEMNNAWSGEDVKGFSKIFGNQTMMYRLINGEDGAK